MKEDVDALLKKRVDWKTFQSYGADGGFALPGGGGGGGGSPRARASATPGPAAAGGGPSDALAGGVAADDERVRACVRLATSAAAAYERARGL